MKVGDEVYKNHIYDGSRLAGTPIMKRRFMITELHDVDPQVNACWKQTYAKLNDGTYAYIWNLTPTTKGENL